ncbi:MAG TPA: Uma2 family endonuclease [Candidatus Acidoferrales bacterium]|nr:Uma2 family endonuclease [Candidatus Acidoferrales bacterium]
MQTIAAIPNSLDFPDSEKPYVESICGRLERKVSPRRKHAIMQGRLCAWLDRWAGERGEVGTEWRFYLVDGPRPSSLVPDVAYVSFARLPRGLPEDARERPRVAPDIAVEIWSPRDRESTLREKIELFLSNGTTVVIVVYPQERSVAFHERGRMTTQEAQGVLAVPGYDDLVLDADALFENV